MVAGTGGTVFSEGMTSGGPGRSCWGKLRSPCRALPGAGGGTEGGGTLSPIGDGGFPARGTEQSTLSWGSLWKTQPPQTQPCPPKHSPQEQGWEGQWDPTSALLLLLPQSWGHPQRVPGAGAHNAQRDSRAPPGTATTKLPFMPWQLPPSPAVGGHGARDPQGHRDPHTALPLSPGDEDVERFRGAAGGRMGAGLA